MFTGAQTAANISLPEREKNNNNNNKTTESFLAVTRRTLFADGLKEDAGKQRQEEMQGDWGAS